MPRRSPEPCLGEVVCHNSRLALCRREFVRSAAEMARVIEEVTDSMQREGYSRKEVFAVRMALEEAIANAHKHGNGGDWRVPVMVRWHVGPEDMAAQVEDQGRGFNPDGIADPLARENIDVASGRGLLLMRAYMSCVCFNERGNRVCMAKLRSDGPAVRAGA